MMSCAHGLACRSASAEKPLARSSSPAPRLLRMAFVAAVVLPLAPRPSIAPPMSPDRVVPNVAVVWWPPSGDTAGRPRLPQVAPAPRLPLTPEGTAPQPPSPLSPLVAEGDHTEEPANMLKPDRADAEVVVRLPPPDVAELLPAAAAAVGWWAKKELAAAGCSAGRLMRFRPGASSAELARPVMLLRIGVVAVVLLACCWFAASAPATS
mmetsp:Transcript_19258/g.49023  ORF Transcript_19258/g.49023 Transcript_19258/m.49023 type:complete len:209 (+) Transcript_19258:819-1445(+)